MAPRIGVLALQGGFAPHRDVLRRLGADVAEVRRVAQLDALDGLVIPGGESTTLLNLMGDEPWFEALRAFHTRGGRMLGTCAGGILLSREARGPTQPSLGLLDVAVERNAYGRQVDSFEATVDCPAAGGPVRAVFIRAPRFLALGPGVETIARFDGEPVMVRQANVLAMTFHPELVADDRIHRLFLEMFDGQTRSRAAMSGRSAP